MRSSLLFLCLLIFFASHVRAYNLSHLNYRGSLSGEECCIQFEQCRIAYGYVNIGSTDMCTYKYNMCAADVAIMSGKGHIGIVEPWAKPDCTKKKNIFLQKIKK